MRKFFIWTVDHPWWTIGIIAIISLGFLIAVPQLTIQSNFKDYLSKKDPAVQALDRAESRYGKQTLFMVSIVAPDTIFNTRTLDKIVAMRHEFAKIPGVAEVWGPMNSQIITGTEKSLVVEPAAPGEKVPVTPQAMAQYKARVMNSRMLKGYIISTDGKAAAISIKLNKDADETAVTKQVIAIVNKYKSGPEKIYIAGTPYMNFMLTELMRKNVMEMLLIVFLVIITVLFLSFFSLRGVLLPLLVVSLSVIWTVGTMALFHAPMTVMSFILPILLIAIGIADGIHILNRYYDEGAKGLSRREMILNTMEELHSPVVMTSLTTAAAFLSFMSSFLIAQQQFGLFAAFGVMVAMFFSLTLIPALLAVLPVPKRKTKIRLGSMSRVFSSFEGLVFYHRKGILIGFVAVLIAFGIGTAMVRVETSQTEFLGKGNPVVHAVDVMDKYFSGSAQVVVEFDTGKRNGLKNPQLLKKIVAFENWLETKPGIKINKTISLADLVREMNQKFHADNPSYYRIPDNPNLVAQLLLLFTFQGGDLGNMALGNFSAGEVVGIYSATAGSTEVKYLAHEVPQYLKDHFAGVHAEMVGWTRLRGSIYSKIVASQIMNLLTSIIAVGLIVTLMMGSLVAALISLIPLVLTVVIAFGVMGFSNTPLDMATLMIASIVVGVGVDYAIHFITRFQRGYRKNHDIRKTLEATLQTTGRAIAYNALTVSLGFAVLLFSAFKGTRNFGLLIAMTMIISAISTFTIVPAVLAAWKPKFLLATGWGKKKALSVDKPLAAAESACTGNKGEPENKDKSQNKEDNHEKD